MEKIDADIAEKAGTNGAAIFDYLKSLIEDNKGNPYFLEDGKSWACASVKEISESLGYLTESQVRNGLRKLKEHNLICVGNFNEDKFDKRKWYAIQDGTEGSR